MFDKENWLILCINTIITVVVLILLFKYQDSKIKTYFKKLEKKNIQYIENNKKQINNLNNSNNISNNNEVYNDEPENNVETVEKLKISNDMDSFIDPIQNN